MTRPAPAMITITLFLFTGRLRDNGSAVPHARTRTRTLNSTPHSFIYILTPSKFQESTLYHLKKKNSDIYLNPFETKQKYINVGGGDFLYCFLNIDVK